ncbi:MAG: hypothetical protein RL226_1158 [Bacteroidota bacterium]|jgi:hypothetical protein
MRFIYITSVLLLALSACKKDKDQEQVISPTPSVCSADEYCFTRDGQNTVDFSGQTARLLQLSEISTYLKSANSGAQLDADILTEMFSNNEGAGSSYFSNDAIAPGKQLKNKCFLANVSYYEDLFSEISANSGTTNAAEEGQAGIITSTVDPSKKYLVDANGFEYTQLIEKGLMGDVFYYQALNTYITNVESGTLEMGVAADAAAGKYYSEAEHAFDEAFGYFGVPVDFPTNTSPLYFYGKYCSSRDGALGTNDIMSDFIAARKALVNSQIDATSIDNVRMHWQRVIAGTVINYLKQAKETEDMAVKCHVLSEAYAFIGNLLFNNSDYSWTPQMVSDARAMLGTSLYQTSDEMMDELILFVVENTELELVDVAFL